MYTKFSRGFCTLFMIKSDKGECTRNSNHNIPCLSLGIALLDVEVLDLKGMVADEISSFLDITAH